MSEAVRRTAGVLGGMGPGSTVDFFAKLLRAAQAEHDQHHVRVLIDSNPLVPDRNAAVTGRGPSPGPALAAMARGLEAAGADFLVMVCNTAHRWQDEIESAVSIPFVSIIEATVEALRREHREVRVAGLLATSTCGDAGLYQTALSAAGIETLVPHADLQERFMQVIYRIKSGDCGAGAQAEMQAICDHLVERGAQVLIAGCTEVPLVLPLSGGPVPVVSSTDVLVARTLAFARGAEALPGR